MLFKPENQLFDFRTPCSTIELRYERTTRVQAYPLWLPWYRLKEKEAIVHLTFTGHSHPLIARELAKTHLALRPA